MKLIPKKQKGASFTTSPINHSEKINEWLGNKTTSETAVSGPIWGPIAGYNAASKIFKINPEIAKQYGGSASKYANFLKATYWHKKMQRGYRFNLEKKDFDEIEEEVLL